MDWRNLCFNVWWVFIIVGLTETSCSYFEKGKFSIMFFTLSFFLVHFGKLVHSIEYWV